MNTNNTLQPHLTGESYVPYFYQRGLHYAYNFPGQERFRTPYDPSREVPVAVPDTRLRRALDHPQTVEQIIANGYLAAPKGEPEFAILHDKAHTSWLGLDDAITQVRRRYEIHNQIMFQLDYAICASVNAIYQHEAYVGPGSRESNAVSGPAVRVYRGTCDCPARRPSPSSATLMM